MRSAIGGLAQLTHLYLFENKIGDAGLTALAKVCANGSLAPASIWVTTTPPRWAVRPCVKRDATKDCGRREPETRVWQSVM